ncbi:UNVERIFIED_CONTAM: Retrovirus-related Pol polyprotein from transposon RE2 [Sesamum latifolium]|uniref:Retrovirus-related Pol polyprotein from transposon RE2 n=1 Tax=Sesamum latifolium TaxID=2727402 RepID=A0AAW2UHV4_9LAMI
METNKFNGTNYNDWLRNLRIVLDFENQGYVLDKPLPTALPEGSSPEERVTFDKWHEDNRKVRSIILASMTNEIQKQYAAAKVFFGTKMAEGSSVQSHGVTMLSLVEKLEDLKAGLNNDTYIDVILQSLPPSYDPFIVNYNMNGLEKSIHELINMLVQYEATTRKSEPSVLVGEASTSKRKARVPDAGRGRRVLQRSRKLSKDEMILRLGNGKAVAAEAVGSLSLVVSDHVRIELKDCYFVPSMVKNIISISMEKMTKKPFVGQSAIAKGLLDLVHTDVCGPLSIPARGGFSYFITFTDDHSRYGYVYLMRYKSEAFGREWDSLSVDSSWTPQLNGVAERRNRTLLDMVRSMMSFTELPPSFWGHALETAVKLLNISPSKSIPQTPYEIWHGKPASYKYLRVWGSPAYVKRLVGDKLDSAEQKVFVSRNAVFLKKDFPSDNQRDEVLIESSGEPPHDSTASFEPTVHTDGVPILRRSTRESRVPERYGFVGLTNPPKGVRPVGCKWVYKRKLGANGEVTAFKARLVAKGYTQRPGVDFEETYSPVAMAKSIRILLA